MSVAAAALHKAIQTLWNARGLDGEFNRYWSAANRTIYEVLNDGEAAPQQPFPYCVFVQEAGTTTVRMTGHSTNEKHEIHDIPWEFRIHARVIDGNSQTAKEIAAALAEVIIQEFGGHPTMRPQPLTLDSGAHLITQYQNDFGIRTGDDEYQWTISYLFRLDVPVMV